MEALGLLESDLPVINFIQHTRHAGDWSIQSRYLKRRAIRICVSDEVAQAVESAGGRGRTIVIPNSVDVPVGANSCQERSVDLLIAGLKQPEMAVQAAAALQKPGRTLKVLDDHIPREEFLAEIAKARNVLFLPNREEGFYLPALEGMALGALVICPDCVGNRGFMSGRNAMFPKYELPELIEATETAIVKPERERAAMLEQARATVARHQPMAERAAYGDVLRNLDQLWSEA